MSTIKGGVLYKPSGRAGEYAGLAINLYAGCTHGCLYCYVPAVMKRMPAEFWAASAPRDNVLARLAIDLEQIRVEGSAADLPNVLLSFGCDPYQPAERIHKLTRRAIVMLHDAGLKVTLLTKAGALASRDFELLLPGDEFATTLTLLDAGQSAHWEPGAGLPECRILNLELAFARGIRTWVSLEPVIDPAVSLRIIERVAPVVSLFKLGKMNYGQVRGVNWKQYTLDAVALCERLKVKYMLKNDLRVLVETGVKEEASNEQRT